MFQGFRKTAAARGRAAVSWHGERAALVRAVLREGQRPRLAAALHNVRRAEDSLADIVVGGEKLAHGRLSTVLDAGSYDLLLEELPNAPREEMRSALGWRIRDRIDMPLEDAVIELLEMPETARGSRAASAYAVVARQEDVRDLVRRVKGAGLKLETIDLPELAMRNLARLLPQDADGVALLHFTPEGGTLTVTRDGVLYLVRHLDIDPAKLDVVSRDALEDGLVSSICLDLQRSLDYYETQYDLPSISSLVLGPGKGMDILARVIAEQLGLGVSVLDLGELFELDEPLDADTQSACLVTVGAALRADRADGWN